MLFLDEPTIGLDPQTRAHVWSYIEAMREEQDMTIFLTTHYMEEAEKLADRVAIIDHGRIIAEGSVEELKRLVGSDVVYLKVENGAECFETDLGNCTVLPDGRIDLTFPMQAKRIPKISRLQERRASGFWRLHTTDPRSTMCFSTSREGK